jgi:hypothetical protein
VKVEPKILVILGMFLYILFLQNCSNTKGNKTNEVTTVEIDTTRTTFVDTIKFIDTVLHRIFIKIKKPVIINDSVNEYTNDFTDSLLTGSVWTQLTGKLLDQKVNYTPKFPQYIFQVDTVIINTNQTTVRSISNFSLNVGVEVGGNEDQFNFSPVIGLTNKKGNSYSYRYGVLDKTHNIGIMYKFKL